VYGRFGTFWESRYKASLVNAEQYLLASYCYIEMNPVTAGMHRHPGVYLWSSFRCNAWGGRDDSVCPHALYLALGKDTASRQSGYRDLFASHLTKELVQQIRTAVDVPLPLGNGRFSQQIERALGWSIGQAKQGRPFARRSPPGE
jgi:putative transposase